MSLLSAYQDLITSEHRGKPKYMATVTALLQHSTDIYSCGVYLDDQFDLDLAEGKQEDILGENVGKSRKMPFELITTGSSTLDNESYRTLLKATIAKNLWKGGIEDLEDIWLNLFQERIRIVDNQDMTIEVQILNVPTSVIQELIVMGQIVPKPQSVYLGYNLIRDLESMIYVGAGISQHKRFTVYPAKPTDQTENGMYYIGGAISQHIRYEVSLEPPTNQEVQKIVYFGGGFTRHKKFTVQETEE
jgi:hypothetical protein